MADWETDSAAYGAELATRRGAGAPATIGEIMSTEWQSAGLDTLVGSGQPLRDAYQNLLDGVSARVDGNVGKAAADRGLDWYGTAGIDEKAAMLGQIAATLPEDQRKEIEPLLDVRRRAAEAGAKVESDAADVAGRTYGLTGHAMGWLSGTARWFADPINLASMFIGGPEAGGVLMTAGRLAAVAAATQAIQEPALESNRAALGLDAGVGRAAENIGGAAAGAFALPLLFHGAGAVLRKVLPRDAPVAPGDFEAAAQVAARDVVSAGADSERLQNVATDIEAGRPPDAAAAPLAETERVPPAPETPAPAISDLPLPEEAKIKVEEGTAPAQPEPSTKPLGDPQLAADAARVLDEAGGDLKIHLGDGEAAVSAREALAANDEDATAARELSACVGGTLEEP